MQPTISKSSIEAECHALGYTIAVTIWIQKLFYDLVIIIHDLVHLYYDNISATYMSANPIQYDRNKHIAVDYHFICEWVDVGDLMVQCILTSL